MPITKVTSQDVKDQNVKTVDIEDGAVTTAKISDANVTNVKLDITGVTAGTYGASSLVVNAQGRITSASDILTTKGDILAFGSSVNRLGVGTDGMVLAADSSQALGIKWLLQSAVSPLNYDHLTGAFNIVGLSSLGSSNFIVGSNSGATALEYKSLLGTSNQISIAHGVGSVTLSTPQDIHTGASPTFLNVTSTSDPVNPTHLVTKQYLESELNKDTWKRPVRVATTENIVLSGLQTVDGTSLSAGDRVLVKDQTDTTQNGIYVASSGSWTRSLDADSQEDMLPGSMVVATHGSVNNDKIFAFVFENVPVVFGTTEIIFSNLNNHHDLVSAALATTTSTSYVDLAGMSIIPGRGVYVVIFDGSFSASNDNRGWNLALFRDSDMITGTESYGYIRAKDAYQQHGVHAIVNVDGFQALNMKFRLHPDSAGGPGGGTTISSISRHMLIIRLR